MSAAHPTRTAKPVARTLRPGAVALAALLVLLLPEPSRSQQPQQISGMDAQVEGTVTRVSLTLLPQLQTVSGEAYQWLEGHWRESAGVTVSFRGGYAVGAEVGLARLQEQAESGHALATDFVLDLLWERRVRGFRITAGPVAGYGRVSRPAYGESPDGFVAGGKAAAAWTVLGHLELTLDAGAIWSSFNPLSFATPPPVGLDENDAVGRRLTLGLGLAYPLVFGGEG